MVRGAAEARAIDEETAEDAGVEGALMARMIRCEGSVKWHGGQQPYWNKRDERAKRKGRFGKKWEAVLVLSVSI
jgi:hypothetical protein